VAEPRKPRIRYGVPTEFYPHLAEGWYVLLPDWPDGVVPECFDTWPQALARVKQWYEEKDEQRRRIQGKIALVVDRLKQDGGWAT